MNTIKKSEDAKSLLDKPVWQLFTSELLALIKTLLSQVGISTEPETVRISGVKALAEYLNCSESTIYALKKKGVLEEATLSHIGRSIVFDGPKARDLASSYQKAQPDNKSDNKPNDTW